MGTIVAGTILAAAVLLSICSMRKNRKKGKSVPCGGNCGCCRGCR